MALTVGKRGMFIEHREHIQYRPELELSAPHDRNRITSRIEMSRNKQHVHKT